MFKNNGFTTGLFLMLATSTITAPAKAQRFYSGKTVRLVVGYAPGC